MDNVQARFAEAFALSGRRALITGASSGLGRHFAHVLAGAGAEVTLAARRANALEAACAEIDKAGGEAQAAPLDVTDEASVVALFAERGPFDIVINNAGISAPSKALDMSVGDFDKVTDVNLRGVFLVAREAARSLVAANKGGSIVNIASILGLRVAGALASYTASKAAVLQLTRSLALEWARHQIRVNAICPGYIETEINEGFFESPAGAEMLKRIPQRRIGDKSHLDGALLLLASDAGTYMTGSHIVVDGGHSISTL
ncbi:SDR family NAD(P)-dependent oxidoreductase [Jiella mangrovi]|uniref:SDR family oxidoreductase n=1 Tax=Jiella mangrovi TaxID=2821407 RepID=A0ABS4BHL5_9HYPH|nr:SDR family oxidoreductase [Jiella mangrovi]MBP0616057.1 SDR family oxidoreductase [Jiella mangrovi]